MNIRVGQGYDVHKLAEGYELWLGGIKVEHTKGSVGHSDADVVLHVLCDSLLGAAGLRDIGYHFPDTDPSFKGIDSKKLLKEVVSKVRSAGWEVANVDCTLCLQKPKIATLVPEMVRVIASVMEVDESRVSVKATTTETLGFVGKEEGVSAHAVALIYKG